MLYFIYKNHPSGVKQKKERLFHHGVCPHDSVSNQWKKITQALCYLLSHSHPLILSTVGLLFVDTRAGAAVAAGEYEWSKVPTSNFTGDVMDWLSIASSDDGAKLAAVARGGYIYTSTDSGATWTERTAAGSRGWFSIASSSDGSKLAAVVNNWDGTGSIHTSADSGVTWTEQMDAGQRDWISISSSSDGTKLAAVADGDFIYTSTDSGVTWTGQTAAGSRYWSSISSSSDGTKLAAVVRGGYIYTSDNSGATWVGQTAAGQRGWTSIASSGDGMKLVAAVGEGSIYTSTDAGVSWVERPGAGSYYWSSLSSSDDGVRLVATVDHWDGPGSGGVYTSTDSGATWTKQASAGGYAWRSTSLSSDGVRIAAAVNGGSIYMSIDSSVTWTERTVTGSRNWYSIASSSDGTKLAAAAVGGTIHLATLQQPTLSSDLAQSGALQLSPANNSQANALTVDNTRPTFSGIGYANGAVTVTVNSDPITCSTTADAEGRWSCTLPSDIPEGHHTVTVALLNPATNQTTTMGPYHIYVQGTSDNPSGPIVITDETTLANTGLSLYGIATSLIGLIAMALSGVVGSWARRLSTRASFSRLRGRMIENT